MSPRTPAWRFGVVVAASLAACSGTSQHRDGSPEPVDADEDAEAGRADADRFDADMGDTVDSDVDAEGLEDGGDDDRTGPSALLTITFLGVQGFLIEHGDDVILTAPLFTNPNIFDVLFSEVQTNEALVDRFLDEALVADVRAIISGHAHYDHLMDVPYIWTLTDDAVIYGNQSARHLLAGFAPDPSPGCEPPVDEPWWSLVPREKVVALNDPEDDRVDYRLCGDRGICRGPNPGTEGEWIDVPRTSMRIRALCSSHPDQFLFVHYGEGCVGTDSCAPPARPTDWLEGDTLAFLIDFMDRESGAIRYRVYYQDAPTTAPVGHVHGDILGEKDVDVAILCVGSYEQVRDHPGEIIASLSPRYVLLGHWEDFFRTQLLPVRPLPFLDLDEVLARVEAAMPPDEEGPRYWLPNPGDEFSFE